MTEQQMKEISRLHNATGTTAKDVKMARLFQLMAGILLAVIIAVFGTLYYWTLVPAHIIEVHNQPMPVKPDPAKPETGVFVHFDYCKVYKGKGNVRVSLVSNKTEIFQPMVTDEQKPGCQVVDYPILLPPQATTDIYKVHFRIVYKANPLRTVTEDFYSKPFRVE